MAKEIQNYLTFSTPCGEYRLFRSDERNIDVEVFATVKAKRGRYVKEARETDKWVHLGHFGSSLTNAVKAIYHDSISKGVEEGQLTDIKSLLKVSSSVEEAIIKTVETAGLTLESFPKPEDKRGRKSSKEVAVEVAVVTSKEVPVATKDTRKSKVVAARLAPVATVKRGRGRPRKIRA